MTDREHLAAASVWAVALLALAASWGVVVRTDREEARRRTEAPVSVSGAEAAPYAGLVAAPASRRRVVVVRRSRAS